MQKLHTRILLSVTALLALLALSLIWTRFSSPPKGSFSTHRDIYHIYEDASLLANGENPYSRIASGNMKDNEKYTFYLPGFLLFAAGSIHLGLEDYQQWMPYWLSVSLLFHICIGVLLFLIIKESSGALAGTVGALFWIFSRWPLALLRSGQIDSIPIFFFVAALLLINRNLVLSAILLSISLAIKQMAALVAPLYLIWAYKNAPKKVTPVMLALVCIPFLLSVPFLIWDFESFFKMVIFPLTRDPQGARSVDVFLRLPEKLSKAPFLAALLLTYWLTWKEKLSKPSAIFFTIMVTLSFNPVFFSRYFCWAVPLIPIVCFEKVKEKE